ncbi:hypothetical protein [Paludibacterium denitrificans]|uniref:hypothetical protein n=1 Tax=Paludibacterium denitrificans TaxID=2675226 RepID=UPI001E3855B2|nr:hypothetical protein [Paludibacterium denitrificans]
MWWLSRYRKLVLSQRAHGAARLPEIHLVDTRRQKLIDGLAEPVIAALQQRLARRQMSLVFINRRGFAPVVACSDCGWTSGCPRCSTKLVVHLPERKLRCHHCGWEQAVPLVRNVAIRISSRWGRARSGWKRR